jgi:Raf kinase inhibitor-like YbhB/YbcL family protein
MRTRLSCLAVTVLAVLAPLTSGDALAQQPQGGASFTLTSTDVVGGAFRPAQIADTFGCTGGNVSPQLSWSGAPAGTQSYVLTIYDPDAPTGSGFWHWVVANIPASTTSLPTGASRGPAMPAGAVEVRSDFGTPGYGGPCPPTGETHRYVFTVYALKVPRLDVTAATTPAVVGFMTNMSKIASATFTVRHGR